MFMLIMSWISELTHLCIQDGFQILLTSCFRRTSCQTQPFHNISACLSGHMYHIANPHLYFMNDANLPPGRKVKAAQCLKPGWVDYERAGASLLKAKREGEHSASCSEERCSLVYETEQFSSELRVRGWGYGLWDMNMGLSTTNIFVRVMMPGFVACAHEDSPPNVDCGHMFPLSCSCSLLPFPLPENDSDGRLRWLLLTITRSKTHIIQSKRQMSWGYSQEKWILSSLNILLLSAGHTENCWTESHWVHSLN